jgi:sugar (pentulose or hexulose) kinase
MKRVLGIDLGTHGVRTLVVDATGRVLGEGARPYARRSAPGGVHEQPLAPVWDALRGAVREAAHAAGDPDRIAALAVTHQRGTLAALDTAGKPICPAICDSDERSWPQADWLRRTLGADRLYRVTGCPPVPFNALTKILWWHQTRPGETSAVAIWASVQDWAALRLTGKRASSPGAALRNGVLNVTARTEYAEGLLAELGVDTAQFMPLRPFGEPLGGLCAEAASELGLPAGIPVFPAPGDQPAAVLGTGAIGCEAAAINLGTSFLTSMPVDEPAPGGAAISATLEVLPGGGYALELGSGAGTNVLDWLRETLLQIPSVDELNALAEASIPGAHGVRVVPSWWGAISERAGVIEGLHSTHTRGDIVRATFEGLAYEVRWAWDQLAGAIGGAPQRAGLFGGASKSDLLCQMLADTLECLVYRPHSPQASAMGAAISAAAGLGWFTSVAEAASTMTAPEVVFEPHPEGSAFYREAYETYLALRD